MCNLRWDGVLCFFCLFYQLDCGINTRIVLFVHYGGRLDDMKLSLELWIVSVQLLYVC